MYSTNSAYAPKQGCWAPAEFGLLRIGKRWSGVRFGTGFGAFVLCRVASEFVCAWCFSGFIVRGGEVQISYSNEMAVVVVFCFFLNCEVVSAPGGSLLLRLSMCIHIYGCTDLEQCAGPWLLQRHQFCWPWPLTYTHPFPIHTDTARERGREWGREGEMHPTLELVYTQRICNYSVRLKCPKFLCKMEHLNGHHASAPATNCSARQSQTQFVEFISIRFVVCVFAIQSFLGVYSFDL